MVSEAEQRLLQAWAQHQKGRLDYALSEYQAVVDLHADNPNAWCYLGIALHDKKQYSKAVEAYRRAVALKPQFPIAWNNMGNSLRYVMDFEAAENAFEKALEYQPNYANAYKNRAALRATQGSIDAACDDYERALAIQPNDPELHRNIGVLKLMLGQFSVGWLEYRWRWQCKEAFVMNSPMPKWDGSALQGKRIFLYAEQGLGDTIQFVRYARIMKERGASRVLVHGPTALAAILRSVEGIDRWFDQFTPVDEPFDVHCSLMDCADVLDTNLANIPGDVPYIKPAKYLEDYWASYFKQLESTNFKIGIAWQGNRDHQSDHFRSMKLAMFRPLLQLADVQFFSLQQGYGSEQIIGEQMQDIIHVFPEGTDKSSGAFMDTAAIMQQLDLIITTDTSIAHLAGALARPTWVLLSVMPDWRWLLHREDSPWYPTMRLFRQRHPGDWAGVVEQVKEELQNSGSQKSS